MSNNAGRLSLFIMNLWLQNMCYLGPPIEHNGPKSKVLLHFLPFFQFFLGLACARAPRNSMFYCKMVPTVKILVVIWVLNTILYLRITHLSSLWTCRTNGGVAPLHTEIFHNFSLLAVVWDTLGLVSPPTSLFLSQSISGGPRGGNPTHLRPRGTPSEPQNYQQYTQINWVFLCRQIHG